MQTLLMPITIPITIVNKQLAPGHILSEASGSAAMIAYSQPPHINRRNVDPMIANSVSCRSVFLRPNKSPAAAAAIKKATVIS